MLKEVLQVMRFWLDMGIDGLRLDAVPYLVEREGTNNENLPETHAILKKIRATIDAEYPNRMLLAEANQWPEDVKEYFGDEDECHMAFHFPLMPRIYMSIASEDRFPITDIMRQTPDLAETNQWAIFLRNHDELTLEMVTDSERDYLWNTYASDRRARLNLGIRRRLAPLMERDRRRIELINSLLLSMPGTPVIYYGDELGMGDNIHLGDRDGVRTPMQWSSDRNGGFSRADPEQLVLPPVMGSLYGYDAVNVESQSRDPHSLLNWTRKMLAVRRSKHAFGRGTIRFLRPNNRKILAYLRELPGEPRDPVRRESLACAAGRGTRPVRIRGLGAARNDRRLGVPADRATHLSADLPALRLPVVPALPGQHAPGMEPGAVGAVARIRHDGDPRRPDRPDAGERAPARIGSAAVVFEQAALVRVEGSEAEERAARRADDDRRRRLRVHRNRSRCRRSHRALRAAARDRLGHGDDLPALHATRVGARAA